MRHSKRYNTNFEKIDRDLEYNLGDGVAILKSFEKTKFNETVELSINLGVDPRHADQMVRGTVVLPNGTGKNIRVLVLTQGDNINQAKEAGADYTGLEEFVEKIQKGWLEFDVVIATPDVMKHVGKLGRILGTRGMMPNPKAGTVTKNVTQAVKDAKGGKIEFRVDKNGIIHSIVGKLSFEEDKLTENIRALMTTIMKLKPSVAKGTYLEKITLSSTHGPGIKIEKQSALA